MSATIQEQRAEIESASKSSDELNSRLTEAEKGSAVTTSHRSQRDARARAARLIQRLLQVRIFGFRLLQDSDGVAESPLRAQVRALPRRASVLP
jgi:hypothetical protein